MAASPEDIASAAAAAQAAWFIVYLSLPCIVFLVAVFLRYVRIGLREVGGTLRFAIAVQDVALAILYTAAVVQNAFHVPSWKIWSTWLITVALAGMLGSFLVKLWVTFQDRSGPGAALLPPTVGLLIYALRGLFLR